MTQHQHRLIILCPVGAKLTAVVNWFVANIGANSVPSNLGPGLSASGSGSATHRWCNGSFTDAECKAILVKLCQLASVTPPTNAEWNSWTGAQKRTWLAGVRNTVWTNYGIWIAFADNIGSWDNPQSEAQSRGLVAISLAP